MTIRLGTFGNPPAPTPHPPPPPPPPPPLRLRTLKIQGANSWLGNPAAENQKLAYAQSVGMNSIELYDLYPVFASALLSSYLPAFIAKAKSTYGMLYVGAIMGAGIAGFDSVLDYNATVAANLLQSFNNFNKENEFWNYPNPNTETFADWIASMNYLYANVPNHVDYITSAYVNNYASPVWGATEAAQMVDVIDVYQGTNYTSSPDESRPNFRDRQMFYIADAAQAIAKTQYFQPLWSAEKLPQNNFMGNYLAVNGISAAESLWNSQYAADAFTNKASLEIIGFNYFAFNQLAAVIPLP